MAQEQSVNSSKSDGVLLPFLSFSEMGMGVQKELLQAYQRLSRIWLERLQVEVALWTRLVSDFAASKSETDFVKAYTDHLMRQFRMNAEDGRAIFSDYQEIARKIARPDTEDGHAIHDPGSEDELGEAPESRITH
jgi:hypothetical protein